MRISGLYQDTTVKELWECSCGCLGGDLCDTTCTGMVPLCSLQLTWPSMSRLLALSLLTCPSAISARSLASSSSCWALRHRERLRFACSSWKSDSTVRNDIALSPLTPVAVPHQHHLCCLSGTALHCQDSVCLYLVPSKTRPLREQNNYPTQFPVGKFALCDSKSAPVPG